MSTLNAHSCHAVIGAVAPGAIRSAPKRAGARQASPARARQRRPSQVGGCGPCWAHAGAPDIRRSPSLSLDALAGPTHGTVELPASLGWTGRRHYDLVEPADARVLHERPLPKGPVLM